LTNCTAKANCFVVRERTTMVVFVYR